jgi:hypothetical protein
MEGSGKCELVQKAIQSTLGQKLTVRFVVVDKNQETKGKVEDGGANPISDPATNDLSSAPAEESVGSEVDSQKDQNEYDDILKNDQLIREVVEKFGASVSDIESLEDDDSSD